jgi:hypothetical protein
LKIKKWEAQEIKHGMEENGYQKKRGGQNKRGEGSVIN